VSEVDRANLREGQNVKIRLDALPGEVFDGKVKGMSTTASSNVMSGDPSKKFDVLFSIDMQALLKATGATPEEIRQIEETARHNRAKSSSRSGMPGSGQSGPMGGGRMLAVAGMPVMVEGGGPGGGGFAAASNDSGGGQARGARSQGGEPAESGGARTRPSGQAAAAGGQGAAAGAQARSGGRPAGGGAPGNLSAEDRQKVQAAMQKALNGRNLQDLSPEERRQIFSQVQGQVPGIGGGRRGRGEADSDAALEAGPTKNSYGFTIEELKAATPPPPPGKGSSIEMLLRPGLLADVEILVDEIKDAVTIPMQAVFDRDGKNIVFVKTPTGFEAREVTAARRTESTMVISSGLEPGEVLALSDPFAIKKSAAAPEKQQSAPAGLPGGAR
jgi:hypothetical protein